MGRVIPVIHPDGLYHAFVPAPIPRQLTLEPATVMALAGAATALGRLAGAGRLLPNPHILVNPYVAREAVSSSRIEGTQASLSDVFGARAEGQARREDVEEVQNYVQALQTGLVRLETLPISKRLVREIHAILLEGVRGRERTPGEFRRGQNFIGSPDDRPQTATFVPPPAGEEMERALADWESFHHEHIQMPVLIRCALLHYQFETIHPFWDGNGRLGRLLIVFFLVAQGELPSPLLYLSSFFEQRRSEYTDHLQAVRERGELQEWLQFFLTGVEQQASDAVTRAERLADLRETYRQRLAGSRSRAGEVVDLLFDNPIMSAPLVVERLGVTNQGAQNLLRQLEGWGILQPVSGLASRRRRWLAPEIFDVIAREPAPARLPGPVEATQWERQRTGAAAATS